MSAFDLLRGVRHHSRIDHQSLVRPPDQHHGSAGDALPCECEHARQQQRFSRWVEWFIARIYGPVLERALAALDVGLPGQGRRLAGAIVGRALYEGAFLLSDAVEVTVDA